MQLGQIQSPCKNKKRLLEHECNTVTAAGLSFTAAPSMQTILVQRSMPRRNPVAIASLFCLHNWQSRA